MSALNSNLSSSGYIYDLVSAVTQDSLNDNLKAILGNLGSKGLSPITAYYKFNDNSHTTGTTLMTPDEVMAITNGVDVFAIPNGTSNQNSPEYATIIMNLANAGFAYAFVASIGLPPEVTPANLPDILILDQADPQVVTYHSYYQTFQIMELAYGWNLATVSQIYQDSYDPDINPWIFEWEVTMDLSLPTSTAFGNLPVDVQQNLEAMKYDTNKMFSMQQLFLDLNSPRLINGASPSIFSFPATDPIYVSLNEFICNYWAILQNNGNIIFNTAIKPSSSNDYPPSSIIPTAVNFVVTPGTTPGLNTLDYLIMSEGRNFPNPITSFNWSWIDTNQKTEGIMSVRRDIFVDYLNKALSPALSEICYNLTVDQDLDLIDDDDDGGLTITYSPSYQEEVYTPITNPTSTVLTFSFYSEDTGEIGYGNISSTNVKFNVESNVMFVGNQILVTTTLLIKASFDVALQDNIDGYLLANKNVTTFTLEAVGASQNNAGVLSIKPSAITTDLISNEEGSNYKPLPDKYNFFTEIVTLGGIDDNTESLEYFSDCMADLMKGFETDIASLCTSCLGWTFPGTGTYFFSNPLFSNNNDLTVQIAVQAIN